jgi:hypothetical protein
VITPKVDDRLFLSLVSEAPLIAFQKVDLGFALATPEGMFYAPLYHEGGGNLPEDFRDDLANRALMRLADPKRRTLRPSAKPIPNQHLIDWLRSTYGDAGDPMDHFFKTPGDAMAVMEHQTQVVARAIAEHGRPDLKEVSGGLKYDLILEACAMISDDMAKIAEGPAESLRVKLYLTHAASALRVALETTLEP